ncbi:MAG TPA: SRPBCC family protein [Caulobacter sp.]|nr:SRPBCC family protein [Caulobacter sp.]
MMRQLLCAAVLALAAASTALAAPSGDQPWVSVTLDPDGESALINASIDIPAPARKVWSAMTDCDATRAMIRSLVQCRVVRTGEGWDVREHITRGGPLWPSFRYVFRSDYEAGRRIRFRKLDGNLKTFEGEWDLAPLSGGQATRVTYRTRMAAQIFAPPMLVRAGLRKDTPRVLEALRRVATGG